MTQLSADGILVLDKPAGISSMDVVRRIKRASGMRRVGHGGTLDPMATGVIPICLGRATRLMEYMFDSSKEYLGEVRLGISTDSYDAEGEIVSRSDPSGVEREDFEDVLSRFLGPIDQVPPMFSALKRKGKRLYELARQGIEVEREPRSMTVHSIRLEDWNPPVATVHIECSRGFYMRSLAHDIGVQLGCGANLKSLTRLRTGRFRIADAVSIETAQNSFEEGSWPELLVGLDSVLGDLRVIIVGEREQTNIQNGRPVPFAEDDPTLRPDEQFRAYSLDGEFLAIMRLDASDRCWRPNKVFNVSN
ncbi:MAG: tRNA pseudouridine(55) synthase TruB [Dehalococcoidia bacterium]|nr:tRNA pseudouridine(55) synthase TruB [Dehalococcoidia bacterium]